mgnify:CR=1 FL=1
MWQRKEILRQGLFLGRSVREISRSLGVSVGSVWQVLDRAKKRNLGWEEIEKLSEIELCRKLYGGEVPQKSLWRTQFRIGLTFTESLGKKASLVLLFGLSIERRILLGTPTLSFVFFTRNG